ncbi:receptor-type tyrosine-protein phosphatase gamma-like [Pecten maximus]|uniref:receptor-type tyrosine-protein phosphatase gamma-like n=1 Tax=Pecten maximus TaxID=6579 RepID=UPI0014581A10|nr:receptor-type tyrosine-protein phosphatase gamma-like [Pecten maximus]
MLELTLTVVCIFWVTLITCTGASDWSYHGDRGTHKWDKLFPGACAGRKQSPIDIITRKTEYNSKLTDFALFHDPPKPGSHFNILNNGHAVQVNLFGPFFVTNGGLPSVYSTAQFHFHWGHANHHGSEHFINGRASPIELHVVNYDKDNYDTIADAMVKPQGLAVLGVMFEITERDNPVLAPIVEALDMIQDPDINMEVEIPAIRMRDFLPEDTSKYYRYNGSLTTPGCFESVIWTIFEEKQTISFRQLSKFRKVLQKKHRKNGHSRRNRRHMKRGSAAALDEVGIKGNIAQELELEAALKRELTDTHAPEPDHQDPVGHAKIGETPTKFQLYDEEVPKQAQIEDIPETKPTAGLDHENHENHEGHEDHKGHEGYHEEPTPEPKPRHHGDHTSHHRNTAGAEIEVEEVEIIQEYLVNNFRPVQPLNGRGIQRSFEFQDIRVRSQSGSTHSRDYNSYHVHNAGNQLYISYIAIFMSAILSMFL